METRVITKVNNVNILVSNDAQKMVPIKPICEAIGVDSEPQRKKILEHHILSATASYKEVVAKDGKQREMLCLPLQYVFGWLFTINPSNVSADAREAVIRYQEECYQALYEYFAEPQTFLRQKQEVMEQKVTEYQECQRRFKDAKKLMDEAKAGLNQVMRLTIEEWRANNRQLILPLEFDE